MIRVLHVIATLDPAGAERQMTQLCRRLDRAEFDPSVCCLTRGGPLEEDLRAAGVPVFILHKSGRWDLAVIARVMRVIERVRPDIVHTWLPTANTLGRVAALAAKVPVRIASERSKDAWRGVARRMADRALGRRTTRIIANAEAVRRFLIESIGLPAGKIRVIRNGLDLGEFDAAAAREPSAPTPETSGAPVIGTVGRLEPQKGTCYLLDAFARLPPETGPAELWVIGGGPDLEPLRSQAQALGVAARVRFLGPRPDVPALLGRLDLFVLPSLWEGLPNAALEAMAARRAVVATNVDGTPEAVADGVTGLLVPPADADALARAIAILLRDPERRGTLAEAGRRRVEREFGMDRMVAETQQVYREAMAEVRA